MSRSPLRHSLGLLLPLALATAPLWAAGKPPAVAPIDANAGVLDFIADWQGADGQWVDPMTFARIDPAKVQAEDARRRGKTRIPAPVSADAPAAASGASRAVR